MRSNAKQVMKDLAKKLSLLAVRKEMAAVSIAHYKKSFQREGFNNVPFMHWKLLKRPRPAPYTRNKILTRTGRLKNSLRYRTRENKNSFRVEVFTSVPYAKVHNEGLRSGRGRGFKMPKRQFLGYSKVLEKKLADLVRRRMRAIK